MKILHTSDWHVGKALKGRSRAEEHEAVLAEIAAVARRERVDLILVVGDLFETAAPTAESERIVYRALLDLAATGATVALVAGNHDNERRLHAVEPLLGLGNVVARPMFAKPEDGGVIAVGTPSGTARLALLPFLSQRYVVRAEDLMNPERDAAEHSQAYDARVRNIVAGLVQGMSPDTVNLVAAHLMVAGGVLGGGERSAHTIFDYCVSPLAFPAHLHYVALGHLHRVQRIDGPCPIWYCGSPLALDFSETEDDKCVLLIEAAPGRPAEVERVPLSAGRRLRRLEGALGDLRALAGGTGDDFLQVFVKEARRAGLAEEVRELFPDAVDVRVDAPVDGRAAERPSRGDKRPDELFAEFLTARGVEDPRLLEMFKTLWDEAHATPAA